ncbi:hypothetical protein FACS1894188_11810 [Clostridia bacterium]|nr:hypothetical protein FACS1894188_11810 [Clostridia bacterium]
MTIMQVLKRTYPFVILRFVVIVMTILPIYWVTTYFANFFFRLFELRVEGIVHTVMYLNFAMIGCMVGVFVFDFVRKTLLFYIKAAHVIAVTKLCTDDAGEGGLVRESLREVKNRFLSVNLFYIADGIVMKGIQDIGNMILNQDVAPILKGDGGGGCCGETTQRFH